MNECIKPLDALQAGFPMAVAVACRWPRRAARIMAGAGLAAVATKEAIVFKINGWVAWP